MWLYIQFVSHFKLDFFKQVERSDMEILVVTGVVHKPCDVFVFEIKESLNIKEEGKILIKLYGIL